MRIKSHWFNEDRPKSPAEIAGAAAFILKDIGPEDLVTIIRRVHNGEYLINDKVFARPAVASRVLKEFRELAVYGQEAAPIFAPLSPREVERTTCGRRSLSKPSPGKASSTSGSARSLQGIVLPVSFSSSSCATRRT